MERTNSNLIVKKMVQTKDAFEDGYFWEYYMDLERQFIEYLNFVPYLEGNEKTYSFRLANLILSIGAHTDSAFKEIAKFHEFSDKYPDMTNPKNRKGEPRYPNIRDYYPIESEYSLIDLRTAIYDIFTSVTFWILSVNFNDK